jgi:hypothetical protein
MALFLKPGEGKYAFKIFTFSYHCDYFPVVASVTQTPILWKALESLSPREK